jgi:hypothetical protein
VAVATAALVITAPVQEPPLVVAPPPEEDESPEDDEIPDEEDVPAGIPVDDDPADEDEPSTDRCGSIAVKCANLAPMTAAAATDNRPTRQVIFLTRRRPSSRATAALEYWARVTASGSPVILCDGTDARLRNVRIAIAPSCTPGHRPDALRDACIGFHMKLKHRPE